MLNKTTPTMKWLHHGRLEQESASITRRRANRRCSGWPCRRGGRRLRVGCLGDVEGPDGDVKQDDYNNQVAPSRSGEQIDQVLDGLGGAGVRGFESAVLAVLGLRS